MQSVIKRPTLHSTEAEKDRPMNEQMEGRTGTSQQPIVKWADDGLAYGPTVLSVSIVSKSPGSNRATTLVAATASQSATCSNGISPKF